ncbi:uncharacterized protein [Rutidosis leptorrhynchoides]|uniref:uncharacterized protein n=1 Tax=Rutidosis leptorrhynchoides TaxID=125765 RepID=UPI003A995004
MREKSEVFSIFKKFKNFVEKSSGRYIKTLRSDRGKEYTSTQFNKFCEDEGVKRQLTVGYAPEQNGVSERKNRTVMKMAKTMIHEKGLPNSFWAEAIYTAVYILNRCPAKAVENKTPIESWSGKKPSAKHLRVFGSIFYIHILKEKRYKLQEKSEKGIFLGYSIQSKGYRVYNLKTNNIVISRDVEFDKDASWNWEKDKVEKQTYLSRISMETPAQQPLQVEHSEQQESTGETSPATPTSPSTRLPLAQDESSPESTPGRFKALAEIYETCNFTTIEPESYEPTTDSKLHGYTDNDWARSVDDMKSTSGYTFTLRSGVFSWTSKKQETVAQSPAEAEYVAAANSANQAIWLRRILEDMGEKQNEATQIFCDNKSAIAIAKNPVFHGRTKHIDIKYHFLRESYAKKDIELKYCKTEEQIADIFTKALPRPKFEYLRNRLGVTSKNIKEEC